MMILMSLGRKASSLLRLAEGVIPSKSSNCFFVVTDEAGFVHSVSSLIVYLISLIAQEYPAFQCD